MPQFLTDPIAIQAYLFRYGITEYTYADGVVNVDGDVLILDTRPLAEQDTQLQVQFGTVTGIFKLQHGGFISLTGCPRHCDTLMLEDLPALETLYGAPETLANFHCVACDSLVTLQGLPPIKTKATITHCQKLCSLLGLTSCPALDIWNCQRLAVLSEVPEDCRALMAKQCALVMSLGAAPLTQLKALMVDTILQPNSSQLRNMILNHTYIDAGELIAPWMRLPHLCRRDLLAGMEAFFQLYGEVLDIAFSTDSVAPGTIEPLI